MEDERLTEKEWRKQERDLKALNKVLRLLREIKGPLSPEARQKAEKALALLEERFGPSRFGGTS
jgi:hypothetical protein